VIMNMLWIRIAVSAADSAPGRVRAEFGILQRILQWNKLVSGAVKCRPAILRELCISTNFILKQSLVHFLLTIHLDSVSSNPAQSSAW